MQVNNQAAQRSYDADDDGLGDAVQLRHCRCVLRPFSQRDYSLIEVGVSTGSSFCIVEMLSNVAMCDLA